MLAHCPRPHPRSLAALLTLGFALLPVTGSAQENPNSHDVVQVFHLKNVAGRDEALSLSTALRNALRPTDRIYLLVENYDLIVAGPPEEINLATRLIGELDQPKRTYRLTYTVAESDGGKRIGVQHFSMVVVTGQRVDLKQGDKVPVLTGSYSTEKNAEQTQFTYLDVGMNFSSTIDNFANGLRLRSKVEQSSIASQSNPAVSGNKLNDDPVVRQSVLEGTSVITPGKPLTLGGIDIVGSTRHIDIEVVAEPLS